MKYPKYQTEIDKAYEMGKEAAKTGSSYDIRYASEDIRRMCNVTHNTPAERTECSFLMRQAWREGFESESRLFVPAVPVCEPKIILHHKRVQEKADEVNSLVYWDWMDNMTPMAAAGEYMAGHWSNYQKNMFLERHRLQEQAFEQICRLLDSETCQSVCIMGVLRSGIQQEESE